MTPRPPITVEEYGPAHPSEEQLRRFRQIIEEALERDPVARAVWEAKARERVAKQRSEAA